MIWKVFSNESWGPSGSEKYNEWKEFKENAIAQRPKPSNIFMRWIYILIGKL